MQELKKMDKFVGLCYYCREELYEGNLQIYENKPFHKKCIPAYKKMID